MIIHKPGQGTWKNINGRWMKVQDTPETEDAILQITEQAE
jgi:hypothetical protein